MKASFDRVALLDAYQICASVVPPRTPKPVLQNIKLTASKDRVVLLAADGDFVEIRLEVRGVKVKDAGEVLLPTARVLSILRESPGEEIRIEGDKEQVSFETEASEFNLPGGDVEHFPEVPEFSGEKYHVIQSDVLKDLIGKVSFAAAAEAARYAINGVMWELKGKEIRLVATDGRRLAVADGRAEAHGGHTTEGQTPVVPTKVMSLLDRSLPSEATPVLVQFVGNNVHFKVGQAELHGRLVEGRYPPYRDVFPKKNKAKIPLLVSAFASAVRQGAILTDQETRGVDFDFSKGNLTLKANVAEQGKAKIQMPVAYTDDKIGITFDPKLVLDMLKVVPSDSEIILELLDSKTAALFKISDEYQYIVMPLTRREVSEE